MFLPKLKMHLFTFPTQKAKNRQFRIYIKKPQYYGSNFCYGLIDVSTGCLMIFQAMLIQYSTLRKPFWPLWRASERPFAKNNCFYTKVLVFPESPVISDCIIFTIAWLISSAVRWKKKTKATLKTSPKIIKNECFFYDVTLLCQILYSPM